MNETLNSTPPNDAQPITQQAKTKFSQITLMQEYQFNQTSSRQILIQHNIFVFDNVTSSETLLIHIWNGSFRRMIELKLNCGQVSSSSTHLIFSGLYSKRHFRVSFNILLAFFVFQFLASRNLNIDASEHCIGNLLIMGPIKFLISLICIHSSNQSTHSRKFLSMK